MIAALLAAGCDVEWGGARIGLETPPPRETAADTGEAADPEADRLPALPAPPLLYAVRYGPGDRARVTPVARLEDGAPAPLDWPEDPPPAWRDRFTARFLAPGTQLPLYSSGRRLGSVILEEVDEPVNASCPGVAAARILVPPAAPVPDWSFAHGTTDDAPLPSYVPAGETTRRMRTFGPVLAERILQEAGEDRPYLARPAEIVPVPLPGDSVPAMAASYLVRDSLAAVPPPERGTSSSLFFVARYAERSGYVPVWSRVARYADAADKEAFGHLDWLPMPGPDLEILRRFTAENERLAAAVVDLAEREGEVVWVEGDGCPLFGRLGGSG